MHNLAKLQVPFGALRPGDCLPSWSTFGLGFVLILALVTSYGWPGLAVIFRLFFRHSRVHFN